MDITFADRISNVPRSFIREILKVTTDRSIISFAGGLPNRDLFPVKEIKQAANKVFQTFGADILQYGNSEGLLGLREIIAERYHQKGIEVSAQDILITNGSQQAIDLIGKVLVNEGDDIVIEEPGYLGTIQALSIFRPRFHPVKLTEDGLDLQRLREVMDSCNPRFVYAIPNFQNPSGISHTEENRQAVASSIRGTNTMLIEDDPYGELRYAGGQRMSFKNLLPDNTIMLGTFSKTVAPGFRLGWIVAPRPVMDRLIIAKQAADLHTSSFTQAVVYQYLNDNDVDAHINIIREAYGRQLQAMLDSIERYFPKVVTHTHPQGGMFVWATLPENLSSRDLLELAMTEKVIFVPGDQCFVNRLVTNAMRLNFTCSDETTIWTGIERLGNSINKMLN